jgi:hypothetical protein
MEMFKFLRGDRRDFHSLCSKIRRTQENSGFPPMSALRHKGILQPLLKTKISCDFFLELLEKGVDLPQSAKARKR